MNWKDLQHVEKNNSWTCYSQSKLANILFTVELADRLEGTGVTVCALHPGVIATDLFRQQENQTCSYSCFMCCFKPFVKCFGKTLEEGAATTIYCATDPSIPDYNGRYFS